MLQQKLLITFVLLNCYLNFTTALDVPLDSFFSKKLIKCYDCSSLTSNDCRNSTQVMLDPEFQQECKPEAKGCVKQFAERHNGKTAVFRECYYGSISSWYTSLDCDKNMERNSRYKTVKCFKCKGNLCNSSRGLNTTMNIWFYTLLLMGISYVLKL